MQSESEILSDAPYASCISMRVVRINASRQDLSDGSHNSTQRSAANLLANRHGQRIREQALARLGKKPEKAVPVGRVKLRCCSVNVTDPGHL